MPSTLRSPLNELACLTPNLGIKRASLFNRDLRVVMRIRTQDFTVCLVLSTIFKIGKGSKY